MAKVFKDVCVDIETTGTNFFRMRNFYTQCYEPEDYIISIGYGNEFNQEVLLGKRSKGFMIKYEIKNIPLSVKYALLENEKFIVEQFLSFFDTQDDHNLFRIAGYNIKNFDVPFIFYKAIKHRIPLGRFRTVIDSYRYYHNPYLADSYNFVNLKIFKNNFPLDSVLESWSIKKKLDGFHGSMAKLLSKEDLKCYNARDVEVEMLLHNRLKDNGFFKII